MNRRLRTCFTRGSVEVVFFMISFSPSLWIKKDFHVLYNAEPQKIETTFYGLVFVSYIKMTKFLFCLHTQLHLFWCHIIDYDKPSYAMLMRDTHSSVQLRQGPSMQSAQRHFFRCDALENQVVMRSSHFLFLK